MSICPLDQQKCPLGKQKCPFVHWTNGNDHWTFKCPFVHWTNRNVHWTFKCPFVQWTNRNVHWTSKCPFVHWTNGHCLMASTLVSCPHGVRRMLNTTVSYPQGVMLDRITSLQQFWHCKSKMYIRQTEMSIGHSYVHSSNGRTEMSIDINICPFVHWTNRNVHWTSKCPFVHWTNGHCLMASTLVFYPHEVRLIQITSLQLPMHY